MVILNARYVNPAAKVDSLDLNTVTIVPAGSASSVPYLVYLARGRDVVRPPCVALLDSDSAGDEAVKALAKGGPRRKEIILPEFVLQVGAWAKTMKKRLAIADGVMVTELEDLISLPVAVAAGRKLRSQGCRDAARARRDLGRGGCGREGRGPSWVAVRRARGRIRRASWT